jgi:hypothetical protein
MIDEDFDDNIWALSISGLDSDPREAFGWRRRFSRARATARLTFPEPAVLSEQGGARVAEPASGSSAAYTPQSNQSFLLDAMQDLPMNRPHVHIAT